MTALGDRIVGFAYRLLYCSWRGHWRKMRADYCLNCGKRYK